MIKKWLIFFIFCFIILFALGQPKGYLSIEGTVLTDNKNTPGVTVTLYEEDDLRETKMTDENGRFLFNVFFNKKYTMRFEYNGYFSKSVSINTRIPSNKEKKWFLYEFSVDLIKIREKTELADTSKILKMPVALISYDDISNDFTHQKKYKEWIDKQIVSVFVKYDEIKEERRIEALRQKELEKQRIRDSLAAIQKARQDSIQKAIDDSIAEVERLAALEEFEENIKEEIEAAKKNKQTKDSLEKVMYAQKENDSLAETKKIDDTTYIREKEKLEAEAIAQQLENEDSKIAAIEEAKKKVDMEKNIAATENAKTKKEFMDDILTDAKINELNAEFLLEKLPENMSFNTLTYPKVIQKEKESTFKTVYTTVIILPNQEIVLHKFEYWYGSSYYYSGNELIEKDDYNHELAKYLITSISKQQ